MRKLILQLAVSLDGFIEGPNGEYDWCFDPNAHGLMDFLKNVDSTFIGRKSYEMAAAMRDSEEGWGFPKLKEYVFSTTLDDVKPGSTLIKNNIVDRVKEIKAEPGKDIWLFGGAELTSSLFNLGLIDEMALAIHPVILGGGKPLFTNINHKINLKLVDSKTFPSGLIFLTYSFPN